MAYTGRGEEPSATSYTDISALLAQCFWSFPPVSTVNPGDRLSFGVFVPPTGYNIGLSTVFPLVSSTVNWLLFDAETNAPLQSSEYQFLNGDADSHLISLAFRPVARNVKIYPILQLFSAEGSATSTFAPLDLTILGADGGLIEEALTGSLAIAAARTLVQPCETVAMQVVPKLQDAAAIATEIIKDCPQVTLRGALSLEGIIDAFLSPASRIAGAIMPEAGDAVSLASATVADLARAPFAVPLALDVAGTRVTTKLTPATDQLGASFASTAQDGFATSTFEGLLPIGQWRNKVKLLQATWSLADSDGPVASGDLTPDFQFVKSFLIPPAIVSLANGSDPRTVTVSVTVEAELDGLPVFDNGTSSICTLTLPPIELLCLPLVIPSLAAICVEPFLPATGKTQVMALLPDETTTELLPGVAELLRVLSQLNDVLGRFAELARSLTIPWSAEIVSLGSAISVLLDQLASTGDQTLYYLPTPTNAENSGSLSIEDYSALNDKVSAVICISADCYLWCGGSNDDPHLYLYPLNPGGDRHPISCVLPNLGPPWPDLLMIPSQSAGSNARQTDEKSFTDCLKLYSFMTR